jgi:hypothetical protein
VSLCANWETRILAGAELSFVLAGISTTSLSKTIGPLKILDKRGRPCPEFLMLYTRWCIADSTAAGEFLSLIAALDKNTDSEARISYCISAP